MIEIEITISDILANPHDFNYHDAIIFIAIVGNLEWITAND